VLYLTSRDVTHGFAIPEYDIVVKIEPGKTTPVSFIADKEGEFTFYCSIFCGVGHSQVEGKLVVK
jgi:cytochrome c oxidase subunit 2